MASSSQAFQRLAARSPRELEAVLRRGRAPASDALLGYEFRGYNHPRRAALLGIRKFIKGFFVVRDEVLGFNTRTRQNGLDGAWIARPDDSDPRRFAFFRVLPPGSGVREGAYGHALLLDYSGAGNPAYDPSRLLRDHVVRVDEHSDDLLLGKASLALASARVPVGFFLLERHRPFSGDPRRARP
jgi:hypothetical protein